MISLKLKESGLEMPVLGLGTAKVINHTSNSFEIT